MKNIKRSKRSSRTTTNLLNTDVSANQHKMRKVSNKQKESRKNRQNRFSTIQYKYVQFLREANHRSEGTICKVETALQKWVEYNPSYSVKDDKVDHDLIVDFKNELRSGKGKGLSKSYKRDILIQLKQFFEWLSQQNGYKSKIVKTDILYFKPSKEDNTIRRHRRSKGYPTIEQVRCIIKSIPSNGVLNLRDCAFISLLFCTGMRITSAVSLTLEMFDKSNQCFYQDPGIGAKTKYSKCIVTPIFMFDQEMLDIILKWYGYLNSIGFGHKDPLFPKAEVKQEGIVFVHSEQLTRESISTSQMSKIVKQRCKKAIDCEFSPHKFRHACTYYAMEKATTALDIKAISQSLGHESIELVLNTYGTLSEKELIETINSLGRGNDAK